MPSRIRNAQSKDLASINAIYNHYIVGKHTSFDTEPWDEQRRQEWFDGYDTDGPYRVLVAEADSRIAGFASSSRFRAKAGYDRSVETTVIVDPSSIGRGWGRRLLRALLQELRRENVHRAYALIALPNEASITLHRQLGYREVGELHEVGFKLGGYHSVMIMELRLG